MVTLGKGQIFVAKMHDYPAQAAGGQKRCRVEVALFLKWDVNIFGPQVFP
jgi:hypothetical protein